MNRSENEASEGKADEVDHHLERIAVHHPVHGPGGGDPEQKKPSGRGDAIDDTMAIRNGNEFSPRAQPSETSRRLLTYSPRQAI